VEAFLDDIVLEVLIKFHSRMFSAQISSLVLDFITENGRAKPLQDQINTKILLISNCFFLLRCCPKLSECPRFRHTPTYLTSWTRGSRFYLPDSCTTSS